MKIKLFILLLISSLLLLPSLSQAYFITHTISSQGILSPQPLGITAFGNFLYVTTLNGVLTLSLNLTVINFTYDYGASIPLAINGEVYVTNYYNNSVSVINNGVITGTISLGGNFRVFQGSPPSLPRLYYGYGMAYDPNSNTLYVPDSILGYVVAINLVTGEEKTIYGFYLPTDVIYDQNNGNVYVLSYYSNNISVVQGDRVTQVMSSAIPPAMGVIAGNLLYITSFNYNLIDVFNLSNGKQSILQVGSNPYFLSYDPENGNVYVTEFGSDEVLVLNNGQIIGKYNVGSQPAGVLYYNGLLYVVLYGEDKIVALNPNTMKVVYSLTLDKYYTNIVSTQGTVYVTEYYNNKVVEFNASGDIINSVTLVNPYGIASGAGKLFVTCPTQNSVVILSPNLNVLGKVKIPDPMGISYLNGIIYVTSYSTNKLFLVSLEGFVLQNISLDAKGPVSITSYENNLVIADVISKQLSVYSGSSSVINYNLSFTPLGVLAQGDYLYVIGNGTIVIMENFKVINQVFLNPLPDLFLTPNLGGISYNNLTYITYGDDLYVFNGSDLVNTIPLGKVLTGVAEVNGNLFAISPFSSIFILQRPPNFLVTFHEIGLTNGTKWSVVINGTTYTSSSNILVLNLTEGVYNFSILNVSGYHANISHGILNVSGNISVYVKFLPFLFNVSVKEINLPNGTKWGVIVNGTAYFSTSNNITLQLPRGFYEMIFLNVSGYYPNVSSLLIYVPNISILNVNFSKILYEVTFIEHGLPSGQEWEVIVNGSVYHCNTSSISLKLPEGNYTFIVSNITGYLSNISSGEFHLNHGIVYNILFEKENYSTVFIISGIENGTKWTLVIGNTTFHSNLSVLAIKLPYGKYNYTIIFPSTFSPSVIKGSIFVDKNNVIYLKVTRHYNNTLTSTPSIISPTVPNSTTANGSMLSLIGVVVIIVIGIALALTVTRRK